MAVPVIDYQQSAQTLLANVAAAGGAAGALAGGGAARAASTAHYSGDHMDIARVESSIKKILSENCVDTNAATLRCCKTFGLSSITCLTFSRTRLFCMKLGVTWSGSHPMLWTPMPSPTW